MSPALGNSRGCLAAAFDKLGFATIDYPSSAAGPELASGTAFFDALEDQQAHTAFLYVFPGNDFGW